MWEMSCRNKNIGMPFHFYILIILVFLCIPKYLSIYLFANYFTKLNNYTKIYPKTLLEIFSITANFFYFFK